MENQKTNEAQGGADARDCVPRLVRWEFTAKAGELFKWELRRTDGTSAATVWENGVWHTWKQDGSGGENSAQDTVSNAQIEAMLSAINQGFISPNVKAWHAAYRDRSSPGGFSALPSLACSAPIVDANQRNPAQNSKDDPIHPAYIACPNPYGVGRSAK